MSFYKFPRTPHIAGSAVVDDDCVLSAQQLKAQLQSLCHPAGHSFAAVIQEKVDGANVGVHFEDEEHRWLPTCQKRGGVIGTHEKAQYNVFQSWCAEHAEELWESLHADYVLFGEWLWCTHAIRYDQLPDFFIAFDVLEKKTGKFLSNKCVRAMLPASITIVPLLLEAPLTAGFDLATQAQALLKGAPRSAFCADKPEGVYLRVEGDRYVLDRYKLRRGNFVCGAEHFGTATNSLLQPP
eukprot:TRINITY_DN2681_c0_g1_i1.p1 TRINITY_DN2681_c0_g1~~TRINITY_DN2681_c0_g1_i1.p1  ORF type:complete len:239 (-),score=82.76 TRINITY_DN2681_c0_g1_i1:62-778(-)